MHQKAVEMIDCSQPQRNNTHRTAIVYGEVIGCLFFHLPFHIQGFVSLWQLWSSLGGSRPLRTFVKGQIDVSELPYTFDGHFGLQLSNLSDS